MKMLNSVVPLFLAMTLSYQCTNKPKSDTNVKSTGTDWTVEVPTQPTSNSKPDISWPLIDNAASYDVVIASDPNCESSITQTHKKIRSTSLEMSTSLADGEYYVCITANDKNGKSITTRTSNNTRFVIDSVDPTVPNGLKIMASDRDEEISQTTKTAVKLAWDASSDGGSGIRGYQVEYFLVEGCKGSQNFLDETTKSSIVLNVKAGHIYSFKVKAIDRAGRATQSECSSKSVTVKASKGLKQEAAPLSCSFSLTNRFKTIETYTPTFSWSACDDAENYSLVIDDDSDCSSAIKTKENIEQLQATTDSLANGHYYACVYGVNSSDGKKAATNNPFEFVVSVPVNMWRAIPTTDAPAPRAFSAISWTGAEIFIWGGLSGNNVITLTGVNSGGRYNPTTNKWKPISSLNAPMGVMFPSTFWTGDQWIVWGGVTNLLGGNSNEGGVYDPEKDSWTSISTANAPSPREGAELFLYDKKIYVWGGGGNGDGKIYDPANQTWTTISSANAPQGRLNYVSAWTGQKLIVWSGLFDDNTRSNDGAIYDPANDSWTSISLTNTPEARYSAKAVYTGTKFIVWGGIGNNAAKIGSGGIYDPVTNKWTTMSSQGSPTARSNFSMVWTGSKVLIWGGETASNTYAQNGALFDPATNSWSPVEAKNAPTGIVKDDATFTIWHQSANKFFYWSTDNEGGEGGSVGNGGAVYNPEANNWSSVSLINAITPRSTLLQVWTGKELFIWSGFSMDSESGDTAMKIDGAIYTP